MDLTRLAVDAGQFINRAVQYTEESLGQAEKTDLEPGLDELLVRVDATKTWTDQIISQTEVLLQPNAGARLEDRLYGHLDWSVPTRPRAHEVLGDEMTQAGLEMGSNTPYGTALLRCGEAQKQLGEAERKFVQSTHIHFLTPLRSFTEGEYRVMQDERKMLVNKRLDLDIAKTRVRKAHEADREGRNLNANPLEEDYLSHVSYMFSFLRVKWLKMWAQEISQAEMAQRIFQSLFDRQSQITRRVVEGINNTHTNHMRSLMDFVEAQACYFDQCNQHAQELQKQLARIWRVLCVLGFVGASFCVNEIEYEGNYADHYDNEISQDQQEEETPTTPCQAADFSRWDKLFIALEDSHMRQNMLMESLEQCCGGMVSFRSQLDKLARGTCQQCLPSLETACRAPAEQTSVRLQQGLLEIREEEAERERRLNATLHQLLHSGHEGNARLKRLEEGRGHRAEPMGHKPTPRPGGLGAAFGLGMKPFTSGLIEQEVTSPMDMATMQKALVAIATELQKVHLQLSRVIEQAGRTEETHELPRGKK
ncbi:endophilin-B2-like isoform X1 [Sebastes umbrosus]|uniref:endophilin-B2-like isoform X1 n=1 Tax=Sebastes umbrosus TaxID=72105 RepID=UPI0018A08AF4|nr:endophilin-B2-like isoform X1 [Sebastes umbrosus]